MAPLPSPESSIWADIITGKKAPQFEFFAVKIFLGSAQLNYKRVPTSLPQLASELYKLFEKNQNLPSAKRDLEKLMDSGEKR